MVAGATWVDPPTVTRGGSFASYPPQVEEVEAQAVEPLPSLPPALVLKRSTQAIGDHLLVTGRAVQPGDSGTVLEPEESAVRDRPLHYHPATVFQAIMGGVILAVALSMAWLPRLLRHRRTHRDRRRSRRSRHRSHRSSRPLTPHRTRLRPRRRRVRVRQ
ncbi:MAG: hypothetical protein PVF51_03530 [Nitrospirota bacterium]